MSKLETATATDFAPMDVEQSRLRIAALTPEQRLERAQQLLEELMLLRDFEYNQTLGFKHADVLATCRDLRKTKPDAEVVRYYRSMTGCGLREAITIIKSL